MADFLGYEVVDGVAFLTVTHPPVNALSHPVRREISETLVRAQSDPAVQEIVLLGAGATFPAGAELGELGTSQASAKPVLRDLCNQIEASDKPVVALLHGTVFGGGLELALAAHYRLAMRTARFSLPELKLGLVPGAGATQRLPRLLGSKLALEMIVDSPVLTADTVVEAGLVDGLFEGDLHSAATRFCQQIRHAKSGPKRLSESRDGFADMVAYQAAITARRQTPAAQDEATARVIDLVEAAPMLPFDVGLAMEDEAHETSLASDTSKALRHSFLVEHRARRSAPEQASKPKVEALAVLGPGPLAMQIALSALNVGMTVHWGARDVARLQDGIAQIREVFQKGVESGGLAQRAADARLARLKTGHSADMIDGVDIIVHAARGQGDVPAPRHMVRAIAMAARVDELGLRFAPPVFSTRLVEIVQGPNCKPHQIATAMALVDRLGKLPVVVRSNGESIAGRMAATLQRAVDGLVDMGANPYAIDAALAEWGWSPAPFQNRDTMGLEPLVEAARGEGATNWSEVLVEVGRKGWVTGAGFYDWGAEGPKPSQAVPRLLNGARPPKDWAAEDLRILVLGALANEATRMIDQGMARGASDIDLVSILAQGCPKAHGGVMKAVSQIGLFKTYKALDRLPHPDQAFWKPTPIWQELFKNGRNFDAL